MPQDSQIIHEQVYKDKHERGFTGWDRMFDDRDLLAWTLSRFAPHPGPLLDLGCGGGESSVFFARRGFQVTALDFSQTAVELARQNAKDANVTASFQQADLREPLPFSNEAFNTVVDHRALHCLTQPTHRQQCFQEVHRVLRPGCIFFCSTIVGFPSDPQQRKQIDPKTRTNPQQTRYFGDMDEVILEICQAGFSIAAYQVISEPYIVDNLIVYARKA